MAKVLLFQRNFLHQSHRQTYPHLHTSRLSLYPHSPRHVPLRSCTTTTSQKTQFSRSKVLDKTDLFGIYPQHLQHPSNWELKVTKDMNLEKLLAMNIELYENTSEAKSEKVADPAWARAFKLREDAMIDGRPFVFKRELPTVYLFGWKIPEKWIQKVEDWNKENQLPYGSLRPPTEKEAGTGNWFQKAMESYHHEFIPNYRELKFQETHGKKVKWFKWIWYRFAIFPKALFSNKLVMYWNRHKFESEKQINMAEDSFVDLEDFKEMSNKKLMLEQLKIIQRNLESFDANLKRSEWLQKTVAEAEKLYPNNQEEIVNYVRGKVAKLLDQVEVEVMEFRQWAQLWHSHGVLLNLSLKMLELRTGFTSVYLDMLINDKLDPVYEFASMKYTLYFYATAKQEEVKKWKAELFRERKMKRLPTLPQEEEENLIFEKFKPTEADGFTKEEIESLDRARVQLKRQRATWNALWDQHWQRESEEWAEWLKTTKWERWETKYSVKEDETQNSQPNTELLQPEELISYIKDFQSKLEDKPEDYRPEDLEEITLRNAHLIFPPHAVVEPLPEDPDIDRDEELEMEQRERERTQWHDLYVNTVTEKPIPELGYDLRIFQEEAEAEEAEYLLRKKLEREGRGVPDESGTGEAQSPEEQQSTESTSETESSGSTEETESSSSTEETESSGSTDETESSADTSTAKDFEEPPKKSVLYETHPLPDDDPFFQHPYFHKPKVELTEEEKEYRAKLKAVQDRILEDTETIVKIPTLDPEYDEIGHLPARRKNQIRFRRMYLFSKIAERHTDLHPAGAGKELTAKIRARFQHMTPNENMELRPAGTTSEARNTFFTVDLNAGIFRHIFNPSLFLTWKDRKGNLIEKLRFESFIESWGLKPNFGLRLQFGKLHGPWERNQRLDQLPERLWIKGGWDFQFFLFHFTKLDMRDMPDCSVLYFGIGGFGLGRTEVRNTSYFHLNRYDQHSCRIKKGDDANLKIWEEVRNDIPVYSELVRKFVQKWAVRAWGNDLIQTETAEHLLASQKDVVSKALMDTFKKQGITEDTLIEQMQKIVDDYGLNIDMLAKDAEIEEPDQSIIDNAKKKVKDEVKDAPFDQMWERGILPRSPKPMTPAEEKNFKDLMEKGFAKMFIDWKKVKRGVFKNIPLDGLADEAEEQMKEEAKKDSKK